MMKNDKSRNGAERDVDIGVVFSHGLVAIKCPYCNKRITMCSCRLGDTHRCGYCGKKFNLAEEAK